MNRAYAVLTIKTVDEDQRLITGVATTPTPDRLGDVVEPKGAQFKMPLPLLLHHNSREPIGHVTAAKVTSKGIEVAARLAKVSDAGPLKDRLDEAWQSIKAGLIRGLSIGFKPLETEPLEQGSFALRFIKWMWVELSAVTIPANSEATIQTIKSLSTLGAASGPPERSVSSRVRVTEYGETNVKTVAERIAELEERREGIAERMKELSHLNDGEAPNDTEKAELDRLAKDLDDVDGDIHRFRAVERSMNSAQPVHVRPVATPAVRSRPVREELAPGIRFARYVKCMGVAAMLTRQGEVTKAMNVHKLMYPRDTELHDLIAKAAVAGGTTLDNTWASPLVPTQIGTFADFVEFLRPQTIVGRFGTNGIPALRRVPFRTRLITQSSGGTGYWVGEGKAKPLTRMDFSGTTLTPLKVANIAVITMELMRDSSPSAEVLVRDELAAALRERMDTTYIDPAEAAVSNVSPAAITNGVTPIPSSGVDAQSVREDVRQLVAAFIAANNQPTQGVWIMQAQTALALSLLVNALGQPEFPGITINGGTFFGMPVITSEYVPTVTDGTYVILVNASDIYWSDDGEVAVDMSDQVSLQMDNAPTQESDSPPTATSVVSMWQTNSVAFRAERTLNWKRRRDSGVQVLSGVNWGIGTSP